MDRRAQFKIKYLQYHIANAYNKGFLEEYQKLQEEHKALFGEYVSQDRLGQIAVASIRCC